MDMASCGESFLLNRDDIGDQPHWFDVARDMLQMINHFQDEMKPPLLAFCYSLGGVAGVTCASWSPRIFQGVALCDPALENGAGHAYDPRRLRGEIPAMIPGLLTFWALAGRRSHWPSRDAARQFYGKNKMLASWDKRAVALLLEHDLVDLPDGSVKLKTPNVLLTQFVVRPSPPLEGYPEDEDYRTRNVQETEWPQGFYNASPARLKEYLGSVNCPILVQWSSDPKFLSEEGYRDRVTSSMGMGTGGSGGKAAGQVTEDFLTGKHALPLQRPMETAKSLAGWIRDVFWPKWTKEEQERRQERPIDPLNFPPEFMEKLEAARAEMQAKL